MLIYRDNYRFNNKGKVYDHTMYLPQLNGGWNNPLVIDSGEPYPRLSGTGYLFLGAPIWWLLQHTTNPSAIELLEEFRRVPPDRLTSLDPSGLGIVNPRNFPLGESGDMGVLNSCVAEQGSQGIKRVTQATLEIDTPERWVDQKVSYHTSWVSLAMAKPRKTMSLEGFLKKNVPGLKKEPQRLNDILRAVAQKKLGVPIPEYTFRIIRGDAPDAEEFFELAYTDCVYGSQDAVYPSVGGSCMRYSPEDMGMDSCDPHPVRAFCHKRSTVGLAVMVNMEGLTIARTLVNLETKEWLRVYRSAPVTSGHSRQEIQDYAKALQLKLESHLRAEGYTPNTNTALVGCLLHPKGEYLDSPIVPYLDGRVQSVTYESGGFYRIDPDGRDGMCQNYSPPTLSGESGEHCEECRAYCFSTTLRGSNNVTLCDNCMYEYYAYCGDCDEVHPLHDMTFHEPNQEHYCSYCIEAHNYRCEVCDDLVETGGVICDDCSRSHDRCECCDIWTHHGEGLQVTIDPGIEKWLCEGCAREYADDCSYCGKSHHRSMLRGDSPYELLCPECQEKDKEISNEN